MAEAAAVLPDLSSYRFVDDIADVAAARSAYRDEALSILDLNRTTTAHGFELLPVDALSTAQSVLAYSPNSEEYAERRKGLSLDCRRLVGEWYRKLRPEYFSPTRHYFDDATQEF